jgi:hypothetical protein
MRAIFKRAAVLDLDLLAGCVRGGFDAVIAPPAACSRRV